MNLYRFIPLTIFVLVITILFSSSCSREQYISMEPDDFPIEIRTVGPGYQFGSNYEPKRVDDRVAILRFAIWEHDFELETKEIVDGFISTKHYGKIKINFEFDEQNRGIIIFGFECTPLQKKQLFSLRDSLVKGGVNTRTSDSKPKKYYTLKSMDDILQENSNK